MIVAGVSRVIQRGVQSPPELGTAISRGEGREVGVTSLFPYRPLDFPWPDRPLERRNFTRDGRRHPGRPLECTHGCIYEFRLTVYDFVPVPSWSILEDPS